MLSKDLFSIENLESFPGYHIDTDRWNGWARPYFDWETSKRIVRWVNNWSGKEQLHIMEENKVIVDYEDSSMPFFIEGTIKETEDGMKILYGIGTGWWIWDIHDDSK